MVGLLEVLAMTPQQLEQNVRDYVDQIARDSWTLDHQPDPAPDREFYMTHIREYRDAVILMKETYGQAHG